MTTLTLSDVTNDRYRAVIEAQKVLASSLSPKETLIALAKLFDSEARYSRGTNYGKRAKRTHKVLCMLAKLWGAI